MRRWLGSLCRLREEEDYFDAGAPDCNESLNLVQEREVGPAVEAVSIAAPTRRRSSLISVRSTSSRLSRPVPAAARKGSVAEAASEARAFRASVAAAGASSLETASTTVATPTTDSTEPEAAITLEFDDVCDGN